MTTTTAELDSAPNRVTALVARVRTQWRELTARAGEKLRAFLSLPTKEEIARLSARLDELEARLGGSRPASAGTVAEKRIRKSAKAKKQA